MKTISSLVVILLGMFVVIPKMNNNVKPLDIPMDVIEPYKECPNIKARKQKIELLKSHIGILISEVKLKLPNDEPK